MPRGTSLEPSSSDDPETSISIENLHDLHYDSDLDSLPPLFDRDEGSISSSEDENTIFLDKDGNTSTTQSSDSESTCSQVQDRRNPNRLNQEWQRIFYNAFHQILRQQQEPEIYEDSTTPPLK